MVSSGATLSINWKVSVFGRSESPICKLLDSTAPFPLSPKCTPLPHTPQSSYRSQRFPSCFARALKGLKKQIHLGRTYYLRHFRSRFFANKQERFLFACGLHCPSNEFHFEIRTGILIDSYLCFNK